MLPLMASAKAADEGLDIGLVRRPIGGDVSTVVRRHDPAVYGSSYTSSFKPVTTTDRLPAITTEQTTGGKAENATRSFSGFIPGRRSGDSTRAAC